MDLKAKAIEILEMFPSMEAVSITNDGQGFSDAHGAMNHQKEVLGKRSLNDDELPKRFGRDILSAPAKPKVVKLTADELVAKIGEATSVDEVNEIVGSDNRASVTKAADAKIEELNKAAEDAGTGE